MKNFVKSAHGILNKLTLTESFTVPSEKAEFIFLLFLYNDVSKISLKKSKSEKRKEKSERKLNGGMVMVELGVGVVYLFMSRRLHIAQRL